MKLNLDKYYTDIALAKRLFDTTMDVIGKENVSTIIEPSAGNGSFSLNIDGCIAYDIEPEHHSIIKQDFLELDLEYQQGTLFIGNPPFGDSKNLFAQFIKKCMSCGDYIAFILPISQFENNQKFYQFDLIYSEDLGYLNYSDRSVWCSFNIYKRPTNGVNRKPNKFKMKNVDVTEWRRGGTYPLPVDYSFGICSFGAGSFGKVIYTPDTYCQELWLRSPDKELEKRIEVFLANFDLKGYIKTTSKPKIQAWSLRKLLLENIEGIISLDD